MIDRNDFMAKVIDLFDDTDPSELTLGTEFRNLDEWGSLIGMGLMAMSSDEYDVDITPAELQKLNTFEEIAHLIDEKSSSL